MWGRFSPLTCVSVYLYILLTNKRVFINSKTVCNPSCGTKRWISRIRFFQCYSNSKPVHKFKILDRASLVKYLCLLQIHDEDEAKNIQPWIVFQQ